MGIYLLNKFKSIYKYKKKYIYKEIRKKYIRKKLLQMNYNNN